MPILKCTWVFFVADCFFPLQMFLGVLFLFLRASSADFSPPAPIPFHAPQQFSVQNEGQHKKIPAIPSGFFLPPPPPPPSHGDRRSPLFTASSTVQRPPLPLPSLPWEVPERPSASDPFAQRDHFASSLFAPQQQQTAPSKPQVLPPRPPVPQPQQQPPKYKGAKGVPVYPKKWIPVPANGKKIKPKNVEKHRQELVVLSSTTNKELRGDEVQPEQPEARLDEVLRTHPRRKQPKNKKYYPAAATPTYEPQPRETHYPQPATPTTRTAEDYVKAEESQDVVQQPKPYAFNHQQEASGSGFAPLFAAESAGAEHGFIGQETAHPINSGSGDRVAFHIHGEKGPKSYRFGYDTGKGPDRHFRYEQRDDDGNVKGHFGFYDNHGKLQVVHYSADPKNGFSADGGNFGKHEVL
ncbi:proteoglycan 4-like [Ischnura elegans]|uniref:proteoglycan 4-like n=1 Tax=Ischnura elegans TaxID=197161 RepID=UPI001ED8A4FD|nr:proteoglycan 4-like [Ischnura elegans]